MYNIEISDIITIISSVSAAIFAWGTYRKGLKHDRKQDTLDAYNQLQEQALDQLYLLDINEIKEIAKNPKNEKYKQISTYIARIEHFCVGVNDDIYDKETVYNLAHGFLDGTIMKRIEPIINRKNFDGKEYYDNTKKVIAWMNKETKKERRTSKMKKKLLITLIAVCTMMLAFCMVNASAETVDSGTCGNNLTWTLDDEGTLKISGTGAMNQYAGTYNKSPWNGNNSITSLIIDDGVTSIGSYAFYKCSGIFSITMGDSVISIGNDAFLGCSSLTSITISESVSTIDDYAFSRCSSLEDIIIPDSVTSIGEKAFEDCSSLKSITIHEGVTSIGISAFEDCNSLSKVNITNLEAWCNIDFKSSGSNPLCCGDVPWDVSGAELYLNGNLVTDITIPDNITNIGNYTFYRCGSLVSITIPNSVTSIGNWTFSGCNNLDKVNIADLEMWCNIDFKTGDSNPLCNGAKLYLNGDLVTDITIPDSIANIGNNTFYGCSNLVSITIPDSVTTIGSYAFAYCNDLVNVDIAKGVTTILESAFYNSFNLKFVSLATDIKFIRKDAFNGCYEIETVFYAGSESIWNNVMIYGGNEGLTNAKIVYNATKKTYKFETNSDVVLDDITDYAIFTMPTVENDGMTLSGWYDNEALNGEPVTFPYYGDATTLYAAWTDRTGKSFDDAFIAKANQEYTATTTENGQLVYFEFVPRFSKEYRFYTTGNLDTYGYLYNSNKSQLTSNDDAGEGNNFYITYTLTAGQTYYIAAKLYSGTGTFAFVVEEPVDYRINEITIKDMSGNSLQAIPTGTFLATVSFTNVSSSEDTVIVLAQYTDVGAFTGLMYIQTEDVPTGSTIKLSIPVDNSNGDVAKLKAFCWESFASLTPMGNSASFPAE